MNGLVHLQGRCSETAASKAAGVKPGRCLIQSPHGIFGWQDDSQTATVWLDRLHLKLVARASEDYDTMLFWSLDSSSALWITDSTLQSDDIYRSSYGLYTAHTPILVVACEFLNFNGYAAVTILDGTITIADTLFFGNTASAVGNGVLSIGFSAQGRMQNVSFEGTSGFDFTLGYLNSYMFTDTPTRFLNFPSDQSGAVLPLSANRPGALDEGEFEFLGINGARLQRIEAVRSLVICMMTSFCGKTRTSSYPCNDTTYSW